MVVLALVAVLLVRQGIVYLQDLSDETPSPRTPTEGDDPQVEDRFGRPMVVGRIQDPAITESSGLVASRSNPGIMWTHNDSGSEPVLYCLNLEGASCGTWDVDGATVLDWEGIAIGPGPRLRTDYIYIGDIGDNDRNRDSVTVYRSPEPRTDGSPGGVGLMAAERIDLTYPDGPHDAETLMVHPDSGDLYIVTKELSSRSVVFKATAPLTSGTTLEAVGTVRISDFLSDRTGGDISPDGDHVILCTYGAAYELTLPEGAAFDTIWKQPLETIDIGVRDQGEAITYSADGRSLFATSEGRGAPLYRIPVKEG